MKCACHYDCIVHTTFHTKLVKKTNLDLSKTPWEYTQTQARLFSWPHSEHSVWGNAWWCFGLLLKLGNLLNLLANILQLQLIQKLNTLDHFGIHTVLTEHLAPVHRRHLRTAGLAPAICQFATVFDPTQTCRSRPISRNKQTNKQT